MVTIRFRLNFFLTHEQTTLVLHQVEQIEFHAEIYFVHRHHYLDVWVQCFESSLRYQPLQSCQLISAQTEL